jgi:hypothetical protein
MGDRQIRCRGAEKGGQGLESAVKCFTMTAPLRMRDLRVIDNCCPVRGAWPAKWQEVSQSM